MSSLRQFIAGKLQNLLVPGPEQSYEEIPMDKAVSDFKDPFLSEKITNIHLFIRAPQFLSDNGQYSFQGWVEFKNDNTEGKQKFNATDFVELVSKVENFIKSL